MGRWAVHESRRAALRPSAQPRRPTAPAHMPNTPTTSHPNNFRSC